MNTFTLLIFYLPLFILTFFVYSLIVNFKKKENYSVLLRRTLTVLHLIILLVLLLELIFWFILPAYNYIS